MKLLLAGCRPARCSRAHLLFVALLLAIYLATLVFFHVELDGADPQRVAAPRETYDDVVASEKTSDDVRQPRRIVDRRKRVRNVSTQGPTTPHRLEQCADVQSIPLAKDGAKEERKFGPRRRRITSRRKINLVAPTLPWCSNTHDPTPVTPHPTGRVNDSSSFQTVAGHHYVYSAYYDDREPSSPWGVVRVIAVLRTGSTATPIPTLFCHVDVSPSDWSIASMLMMMVWSLRYHTAPMQYYEMCENHGKDYGGWILTCPLPRGLRRPPCNMFLSSSETFDSSSAVSLPVFYTRPTGGFDSAPIRFGVCVPPLFGRVKPRTVIEFVEMTRLLGAEHFVFYAPSSIFDVDEELQPSPFDTVDVDVGDVLRLYSDAGLVTVIPWTLPSATTSSSSGIWYGGQLQAINDCLYRSMHAFDRVVFNDLDEFVVARWPMSDWSAMATRFDHYFQSATSSVSPSAHRSSTRLPSTSLPRAAKNSSRRLRRYCAFSFRSAFFDPMTPPSVAYVGGGSGKLLTSSLSSVAYELESDIRTEIFSGVRTKVMVDPRRVFELGIHHVSRSSGDDDCPVLYVDPRDAFVRHYRQCIRDFDAQMDCTRQCLDDELAASRRISIVRRRTRKIVDTLLHRS